MSRKINLSIKNFAQIRDVSLSFGDLTVLVGAQGTGKSLALQWLKAAIDGKQIVNTLREAGQQSRNSGELVELIFGVGMGSSWSGRTRVNLQGKNISPLTLGRRGKKEEQVFFIPAHRAVLISDGWAAPFQKLTSDIPVVARIFSQNLFDLFTTSGGEEMFPVPKRLKKEYRTLIDSAIFHGGTVALEKDQQHSKRLKMSHGDSKLPFMTWTAGQREFTPLLLGLYHLLPSTNKTKQPNIDWVIIEEPEMGLHPQAVSVFLLLVLDLLWRGYRVVLSTHSSHVLTAVWMLQRLQANKARWQLVCEAFGVDSGAAALQHVAESALKKSCKVYLMSFDADKKVSAKDISNLSPDAENDDESGWGGLTGFSSAFGDAVRASVNERK